MFTYWLCALLCSRFAEVHELRFKPEKRSDMGCAEKQGCLFVDCPECYFQAVKISKKSSTILQMVDLLMLKNSVLSLRKVEIWQWCPAMWLIC